MRPLAACALLLLAGLAQDEDGRGRASVALEIEEGPVFIGQEIRIGLEVEWDTAWFEAHGVPLFLRPLDVPIQVDASWLRGIPGTVAIEEPPARPNPRVKTAALAVGDQVLTATRSFDGNRKGRHTSAVRLERTLVAVEPGNLAIPAPSVRWAWSSRFEEDSLGGRRALERREESAAGGEATIEVLPVPEAGRPAAWTGAIGEYSIDASVSATEVEAGGSIRLVVRISGTGNLHRIDRPGPAAIAGFHVLGLLDDRGRDARTLTYDLSPVGEATREVPALPIAYLEPGRPPKWIEEWTTPIPIRVKPASKPAAGTPPPGPTAAPPAEEGGGGAAIAIGAIAAVLMGAGVAVWLARRRLERAGEEPDPAAARVASAAAALRTAAESQGSDLGGALAEFLAAGLGVPAAAAIGPGLAARLAATGVPEGRAREAAALLESLVAARYGGAPPADAPASCAAIARDLEPIFVRRYLSFSSSAGAPNTRA